VGAAVLVGVALPALGFRWDPFDRSARRIEALERDLVRARANTDAAVRVAAAEASQSRRIEDHHARVAGATGIAADVAAQSQEATDAQTSLPRDRAARLRDADRRLCGLAPDLCGSPAAAEPALDRDDALPAPDAT
jgi:hypothetical protein